MSTAKKQKRQSVTLPAGVAQRVHKLARTQRASASRVLVELIETGLAAKEAEKKQFFALADRLGATEDERERERIKKELAKLTFGE